MATKFLKEPAPDRCFTKLRYNMMLNTTSTVSGGIGTLGRLFLQSSIFNPETAVGGHQPLWHDQWATFFKYYRVHGIRYRIQVALATGNPDNGFWSGIMFYNSQTGGALPTNSFVTEVERKNCRGKHFHIWSGAGMTKVYKGYMGVAKTEGLSRQEFIANEDYWSTFGTNPAKMAYIALLINGYKAAGAVIGTIDLTFYTEMWGRLNVTGS